MNPSSTELISSPSARAGCFIRAAGFAFFDRLRSTGRGRAFAVAFRLARLLMSAPRPARHRCIARCQRRWSLGTSPGDLPDEVHAPVMGAPTIEPVGADVLDEGSPGASDDAPCGSQALDASMIPVHHGLVGQEGAHRLERAEPARAADAGLLDEPVAVRRA